MKRILQLLLTVTIGLWLTVLFGAPQLLGLVAGDPYTTLGIVVGASRIEIRSAYRELSKRYHPDRNRDADTTERFIEIAQAYERLSGAPSIDRPGSVDEPGAKLARKIVRLTQLSRVQLETWRRAGVRLWRRGQRLVNRWQNELHSVLWCGQECADPQRGKMAICQRETTSSNPCAAERTSGVASPAPTPPPEASCIVMVRRTIVVKRRYAGNREMLEYVVTQVPQPTSC